MPKPNQAELWIIIAIIAVIVITLITIFPVPWEKEETIKIGAILSLTGPAASYGNWGKNGLELAINEIEESGEQIDLIIEDDNTDPQKAVSAAQKLIQIDRVKVIIMVTSSTSFLATAPIAEENKVILFASASSSPKISEAGDYIFRNRISGLSEASKAADFIAEQLEKDRIALLVENTDFGIDYAEVFRNRLIELGKKELIEERYVQKAIDFRTNLVKVKSQDPEVVYLVCYINDCINILRQAEEIDFIPIWVSTSGIENQKLLDLTSDVLGRIYYVSEYYDLNDPVIKGFNEKYEAVYGEKSNLYVSNSYDAINIIYSVIEKVGYNPDMIKDYLYGLGGYKGVNGLLTFDENGDVIKPLMVKTVKDGEFVPYGE